MAWYQKSPSGKYRGLYRGPDGKTRSAGTYPYWEQALAKAIDAEEAANKPGWRDPKAGGRAWGDWLDEWWAKRNVAPGTLRRDMSQVNNHIRKKWEKVPLANITRYEVKAWAAELGASGLSESSVYRIVSIFAASLSAAVDAEILSTNPAYRLKLPNGEKDIVRYFTRAQVDRFVDNTEAERDKALISLLAGTGLRWGEAVGLMPHRYNPVRRIIRVAEVWDTRTKQMRPYPKSRAIRDVPVPAWVAERLDPFAENARDRIFPVQLSLWRKTVWAPLDTGGRVHDLRHSYASWLLQSGMAISKVSLLLGHSSIAVTERYAHHGDLDFGDVLKALE